MIYVMSDIHGNMNRYNSIMKQIKLQETDILYVLGDVIDRYYNIIHSFITKYRRKNIIPHLKHKRIKTLVVLGHGIESDKVFLKSIIEKCINIEKIIIYRYANESDINFNRKCSFFKTYCDNIVEIYY